MAKVFVHIGFPKTGTTGIQLFLAMNEHELIKQGYIYPRTGRIYNAHYNLTFSMGLGKTSDPSVSIESVSELVDRIKSEAVEADCHSILLSSEYFSTCLNPIDVKSLFPDCDVYAIIYLREHTGLIESLYSQAARSASVPPWENGITKFMHYQLEAGSVDLNYLRFLGRWSEALGRERLIVRPFEREQNQPSIYHDFLKGVGLDWSSSLKVPPKEANASLDFDILYILTVLQRSQERHDTKDLLTRALLQLNAKIDSKAKKLLPPEAAATLTDMFKGSYTQIAQEYLGGKEQSLFLRSPTMDHPEWNPPIAPSTERIIDLILKALEGRFK